MPSILSRLSIKGKSGPKVFSKAVDNVKKTLKGGSKKGSKKKGSFNDENSAYNAQETSMTVAAIPVQLSNHHEESMDLTNSVMIKADLNQLSSLREESYQQDNETSKQDISVIEPVPVRESSMDTFIEEEIDSLIEEKAPQSPPSSPIAMVMDNSIVEEKENEEILEEKAEEPQQVESVVESEKSVDVAPVTVAPVIVAEESVEKPSIVVAEVDPKPVLSNFGGSSKTKSDVLQALKKNNSVGMNSPSSAVGNLRARFEVGNSKPSPTSFRSVLAAHNNAKFNSSSTSRFQAPVSAPIESVAVEAKEEESIQTVEEIVVTKPAEIVEIKEEHAKIVETVEPVETKAEVVETTMVETPAVVEELKPVEEAKPVEEEVMPVETKKEVALSATTLSLASGEEKAMHEAMLNIAAKPYKEQAVWFLNAYWNGLFKDSTEACERVWRFCHKFVELDPAGAKGCELDELRTHRVLEVLAEALTITEMRTKFHGRARHVSLIELLIFVFSADWIQVVTAPQGSDEAKEQMLQAEALMEKCNTAFAESREKAKVAAEDEKQSQQRAKEALDSKEQAVASEKQATDAERRAIAAEAEATQRAEEAAVAFDAATKAAEAAKLAEDEIVARTEQCIRAEQEAKQGQEHATNAERKAVEDERQAREAEADAFCQEQAARDSEKQAMEAEKCLIEGQSRVEAALLKVKEEEAAFQAHLEDLKQKSENTSLGIVARRTANHEREMLLAKDPEPLTRARIAEEAVVRKHEKLIRAAAGARAAASVARTDSEKSRDLAVAARGAAEEARSESAVRRSAAETKVVAAEDARKLSEVARENACKAREEAEHSKKASDSALESAREAKEKATQAREVASKGKEEAGEFRVSAERDEEKALEAQKLAEQSREQAEQAVIEGAKAVERARSFVERVRKQASSGQGGWWWASREIEESKRYVPQKMLKKMVELEQM